MTDKCIRVKLLNDSLTSYEHVLPSSSLNFLKEKKYETKKKTLEMI